MLSVSPVFPEVKYVYAMTVKHRGDSIREANIRLNISEQGPRDFV